MARERRQDDAYMTPDALALAICVRLCRLVERPQSVIEPSAGGGAFVRAVASTWRSATIRAVDIRPECEEAAGAVVFDCCDWPEYAQKMGLAADLIVGNPPYADALGHAEAALRALRPGGVLAFLLRQSFLSSQRRLPFWREHPLYAFAPIVPRPSFTGGGSDTAEYALFVWREGHRGEGRLLEPLVWSKQAALPLEE